MGNQTRILIIDDDDDLVKSMRVVLESKGYQITAAPNGREGLKEARQQKPDLIILDVMMETAGQGFNVARDLKQDESCKDIPILMLTAVKSVTGLDFGKEAGDEVWLPVDEYAEKPLKPDELISKVELLLRAAEKT